MYVPISQIVREITDPSYGLRVYIRYLQIDPFHDDFLPISVLPAQSILDILNVLSNLQDLGSVTHLLLDLTSSPLTISGGMFAAGFQLTFLKLCTVAG
jgi:hypothetical protein